jgi:hypothetical protein
VNTVAMTQTSDKLLPAEPRSSSDIEMPAAIRPFHAPGS